MAFRIASSPASNTGTLSLITMPTGTVSTDHILIVAGVGAGTVVTASISGPGSFSSKVVVPWGLLSSGMSWGVWDVTGVVAGQQVTITFSASVTKIAQGFVFTQSIGIAGTVNPRSGSSSSSTAPGLATQPGAKMLILSAEMAAGASTVSSSTVSTGEAVTSLSYYDNPTATYLSLSLGEFTAAGSSTGTATVTYSSPASVGAAVQIIEVGDPSVAVPFGSLTSGQFSTTALLPPPPPSTFRASSAIVSAGATGITLVLTMPPGTVVTDHVLVVTASSSGPPKVVTPSGPAGSSFQEVIPWTTAYTNLGWTMWEFTGVAAGQTITLTFPNVQSRAAQAYVFTADMGPIGTVNVRNGTNTAVSTAPARTTQPGANMLIFSLEASPIVSTPTRISSIAVSTGEKVTTLAYGEVTTTPDVSFYLGEFTAATSSPGSATVTYSDLSPSGGGMQIVEVAGAELPPPAVTLAFGGQSGQFSVDAAPIPVITVVFGGQSGYFSAAVPPPPTPSTFRVASTPVTNTSATTTAVVMPAGTVATDHVLIATAIGTGTAQTITPSGPAGMTYEVLVAPRAATNMYWALWDVTGVIAGQTVTLTYSVGSARVTQAFVFIADIGAVGAITSRGASSALTTASGRAIRPESRMLIFSTERTTATPTTVSSVAVATGETVTQLSYYEGVSGAGDNSFYLGEFIAGQDPTGAATITYSGGSTNGAALQIVEIAGTEVPVPAVTLAFGGQSGTFSAAVAAVPVPTATLLFGGQSGLFSVAVSYTPTTTAVFGGKSGTFSAVVVAVPIEQILAAFGGQSGQFSAVATYISPDGPEFLTGVGNVTTVTAAVMNPTAVIAKPANTADGDVLVMFCAHVGVAAWPAPPAGWSRHAQEFSTPDSLAVFWKKVTDAASEPASWTVNTPALSSRGMIALARCINADNLFTNSTGLLSATTGTTALSVPGATTYVDNTLAVMVGEASFVGGTPPFFTVPVGYSSIFSGPELNVLATGGGSSSSMFVYQKSVAAKNTVLPTTAVPISP